MNKEGYLKLGIYTGLSAIAAFFVYSTWFLIAKSNDYYAFSFGLTFMFVFALGAIIIVSVISIPFLVILFRNILPTILAAVCGMLSHLAVGVMMSYVLFARIGEDFVSYARELSLIITAVYSSIVGCALIIIVIIKAIININTKNKITKNKNEIL